MTNQSTDTDRDVDSVDTQETPLAGVDDSLISPGSLSRRLRECREQADLSIEQAALEMHLPPHILKALEEERFTDLPEPPYVRGYLRSYARLDERDPNELIRHYETLRGADPDDVTSFTPTSVPLSRNSSGKKPTASSQGTMKLIGLAFIVFLLGVLSMIPAVSQWAIATWESFSAEPQESQTLATQETSQDTDKSEETGTEKQTATAETSRDETHTTVNTDVLTKNASTADKAAADNTDTSAQLALNNQNNDSRPDSMTETSNQPASPDNNGQPAENAGTAPAEPSAPPEQDPDSPTDAATNNTAANNQQEPTPAPGQAANTGSAPAPATDNTQQSATPDEPDPAAAATGTQNQQSSSDNANTQLAQNDAENTDKFQQPLDGNVRIRLEFTQECWMSIKDSRGKTLYSALSSAGTLEELTARTPLRFKVGNAAGVNIYLNGQLVDQEPHTRGNVATFEVN